MSIAMAIINPSGLAGAAPTIFRSTQEHHAEHEYHVRHLDIAAVNTVIERIQFEKGLVHEVPLSIWKFSLSYPHPGFKTGFKFSIDKFDYKDVYLRSSKLTDMALGIAYPKRIKPPPVGTGGDKNFHCYSKGYIVNSRKSDSVLSEGARLNSENSVVLHT